MSEKGKNPLVYLFGKTWQYSEGNRKSLIYCWMLFIIAEVVSLIFYPLLMLKIMEVIGKEGITQVNIRFIFVLLLLTFISQMIFWTFHGPGRIIECANAFRVRTHYRKYLLKGIMTLPMEWHVDHHSGDTIDKVEKGANGLYDFSTNSFEVIYAVIRLLVSYGMLVYFTSSAAYIVFALTLISAWIVMRFDKVIVGQYRQLSRAENNISESIFDAISNITTVIILRVERLVFKAIAHKLDKPFELFKANNRLNEMKWFLMSVCCNLMTILVLGSYFWNNMGNTSGALILGNMYILLQYTDKVKETFQKFTNLYGNILQRRAKVANAEELTVDFKPENFTNHVLPKEWKKLEIRNLDFSYHAEGTDDLHLEDIFLSIVRGERIAFVGGSGGGKTTLLKVIRDLYHPRNLQLSVDGQIIPQGFGGIARAIALVPQDPEIFASTVLENITLGAEYDMEFVHRFTDMACFTDIGESLPKQFDSSINEKGVNLSVGQKQRLALSRGLLACDDKDIILLDEPTSSLDAITELNVYRNIFQGFPGKTIISTVHGLDLLPLFDRICVFDQGEIVGTGKISELLLTCPKFISLWNAKHERKVAGHGN